MNAQLEALADMPARIVRRIRRPRVTRLGDPLYLAWMGAKFGIARYAGELNGVQVWDFREGMLFSDGTLVPTSFRRLCLGDEVTPVEFIGYAKAASLKPAA